MSGLVALATWPPLARASAPGCSPLCGAWANHHLRIKKCPVGTLSKGQLISKGVFVFFNSSKKRMGQGKN